MDSESDEDGAWDVRAQEFEDAEDFYVPEADEFTAAEEDVFNAFMRSAPAGGTQGGTLLADMIMEKLQAKEAGAGKGGREGEAGDAAGPGPGTEMGETMALIYTDVGKLLSRCALFVPCSYVQTEFAVQPEVPILAATWELRCGDSAQRWAALAAFRACWGHRSSSLALFARAVSVSECDSCCSMFQSSLSESNTK